MATIEKLIAHRNTLMTELKHVKDRIKDEILCTDMYKAVLEMSVHTVDEDAFEVSEKDAAKHAFKVTLKSYESRIEKTE